MSIIPHLEYNLGAYFPKGGMYEITKSLCKLAESLGVIFYFNSKVEEIVTKGKKGKVMTALLQAKCRRQVATCSVYYTKMKTLRLSLIKPYTVTFCLVNVHSKTTDSDSFVHICLLKM